MKKLLITAAILFTGVSSFCQVNPQHKQGHKLTRIYPVKCDVLKDYQPGIDSIKQAGYVVLDAYKLPKGMVKVVFIKYGK